PYHHCLSIHSLLFPTLFIFFFFTDTATTEIYTLSLHDALPIFLGGPFFSIPLIVNVRHLLHNSYFYTGKAKVQHHPSPDDIHPRSEEHTSELQSRENLVCRLLLEKKKKKKMQKVNIILTISEVI